MASRKELMECVTVFSSELFFYRMYMEKYHPELHDKIISKMSQYDSPEFTHNPVLVMACEKLAEQVADLAKMRQVKPEYKNEVEQIRKELEDENKHEYQPASS